MGIMEKKMEATRMENQMGNQVEHEMETIMCSRNREWLLFVLHQQDSTALAFAIW